MAETYRTAVIGSTGRGNYGHGLDTVWKDVPNTTLVAVADDNPEGLEKATKRLGGIKGYPDYRKLLSEEKPQLISIGQRWLDQHHAMVLAAASAGVRGIYLEKPMCRTLEEADAMVAACEKSGTKLAIAYQTRYSPRLRVVNEMIDSGAIGEVIELRGRGKDDSRGGGEDLWVLGSHILNLMHFFGGEPRNCSAEVLLKGKPLKKAGVAEGNEGIGLLGGDQVRARYGFDGGITGYFDSTKDRKGNPTRFGLTIYGSKGVIHIATGYLPDVHWLEDSSWVGGRTGKKWVPVSSEGPGKPEPLKGNSHHGNVLACEDLIRSIEQDGQPEASIYEARTSTEMIAAVFESHRQNSQRVVFPLKNRKNPLGMLED